jgi:hypothetical protein
MGDMLEDIDKKKMYRIVIESNNGNMFRAGQASATLSCRVYSWDDEITDDVDASKFTWRRESSDTTGDEAWNTAHENTHSKTLTVTSSDVSGRSTFYCDVMLPYGSGST